MDDALTGLDGSTRRFLGGILRRSAAGGSVFPDANNTQANGVLNDYVAAQNASYGSVASRNDPNRYGSIASRTAPGLFGPSGSLNPEYQQEKSDYQRSIEQASAMRRTVGGSAVDASGFSATDRYAMGHAQDYSPQYQQQMMSSIAQNYSGAPSGNRGISRIDVGSPFSSSSSEDEETGGYYVNPY